MAGIRHIFCIFLIAFSVLVEESHSSPAIFFPTKTGELSKFFWYPTDTGAVVPAFLEGGPPPKTKANENDIQFFLYTKNNVNTADQLVIGCDSCLAASRFDRNAPVKILCHGFGSNHQGFGNTLKNAYLALSPNTNVININWGDLASAPWYDTAAGNTRVVGQTVARLVAYLVSKGVTSLDRIHFIGHSLGSHVGGFAGHHSTIGKKARITGLDPALPLFGDKPVSDRLDPSDAVFVDIIHTAGGTLLDGGLAFTDPIGDVDFYPNNGRPSQPGCGVDLVGTCSHSRAHEFFTESVRSPRNFNSCKCNNWDHYNSGQCTCQTNAFMGNSAPTNIRGLYYLRTNANPPFGQG